MIFITKMLWFIVVHYTFRSTVTSGMPSGLFIILFDFLSMDSTGKRKFYPINKMLVNSVCLKKNY